ncbi:unnamed protein product, partial [Musa acuminata subsp. burmannicoides]
MKRKSTGPPAAERRGRALLPQVAFLVRSRVTLTTRRVRWCDLPYSWRRGRRKADCDLSSSAGSVPWSQKGATYRNRSLFLEKDRITADPSLPIVDPQSRGAGAAITQPTLPLFVAMRSGRRRAEAARCHCPLRNHPLFHRGEEERAEQKENRGCREERLQPSLRSSVPFAIA